VQDAIKFDQSIELGASFRRRSRLASHADAHKHHHCQLADAAFSGIMQKTKATISGRADSYSSNMPPKRSELSSGSGKATTWHCSCEGSGSMGKTKDGQNVLYAM